MMTYKTSLGCALAPYEQKIQFTRSKFGCSQIARSPPLLLVLDPIILLNHKTNMITVSPGSPDTAPYVSADDGSPIAEVVVPEGRTHQLDFTRVRFVMLPRDLTPLFPTKERLFRFWPALVYRNMGEVMNESLQLNPSIKIS